MRQPRRLPETWRGVLLLWGSTALPAAVWLTARPLEDRTATWQTSVGSLSKLLGYFGLGLFAWAVVLAARLRTLERLFGGLDRAYRHHHLVGALGLTLVLIHPMLLAVRYASVSMDRAADLWLPTTDDWALTYGQLAVYATVPALLATLFMRLRHTPFVRVQQLLGLLLIPAFLHVLLIRGDASSYLHVRLLILVFAAAAAAALAYLYHPVLTRLLTRRYPHTVERIRPRSSDVTELVLTPRHRLLAFIPGQFAFVTVHAPALGEESHPFSIASSPREARLRFVLKHLGDWTAALAAQMPGVAATVEGPYGRFSHRLARSRDQVWIAGGIGIAPFLGMGSSLEDSQGYQVDLWYGYRDPDDPFLDEIDELARHHRGAAGSPPSPTRPRMVRAPTRAAPTASSTPITSVTSASPLPYHRRVFDADWFRLIRPRHPMPAAVRAALEARRPRGVPLAARVPAE